MGMYSQALDVVIDGQSYELGMANSEPLVRAVIISLFTWRRANADDVLPANERMGWWGDTFPLVRNDRIGSRLWLLSRAKLTEQTLMQGRDYAQEALQWLIDDGVASRIDVQFVRNGLTRADLLIQIYQNNGAEQALRFNSAWEFINGTATAHAG